VKGFARSCGLIPFRLHSILENGRKSNRAEGNADRYSVAGRKSLGAKSFRSRRQVSHSCDVPGEEK